jgi:hypothetical protein
MNKRLKELAEQAGLSKYMTRELCPTVIERFADLVRQDERLACAALCDYWFAATAGQAIRARGNHDQN